MAHIFGQDATVTLTEFPRLAQALLKSVEELEFSVRSANALRAAEIRTIGDLVQKREAEMLWLRNFGRKSLREIVDILAEMGLRFGMQLPDDWQPVLERWQATGEAPALSSEHRP
ncbi:MAG: hypothetical protein HYY50_05110 [Candidatus Kerfeldbacteria bacterium]|nr:hypothetical protein [Candidatus Kerfeldbacteria bacterium]